VAAVKAAIPAHRLPAPDHRYAASGRRVAEGENVFSVAATGGGTLLQWLLNGVEVAGATAATDSGRDAHSRSRYSVRVSTGARSSQRQLTVTAGGPVPWVHGQRPPSGYILVRAPTVVAWGTGMVGGTAHWRLAARRDRVGCRGRDCPPDKLVIASNGSLSGPQCRGRLGRAGQQLQSTGPRCGAIGQVASVAG
jgi:hypothetical protein